MNIEYPFPGEIKKIINLFSESIFWDKKEIENQFFDNWKSFYYYLISYKIIQKPYALMAISWDLVKETWYRKTPILVPKDNYKEFLEYLIYYYILTYEFQEYKITNDIYLNFPEKTMFRYEFDDNGNGDVNVNIKLRRNGKIELIELSGISRKLLNLSEKSAIAKIDENDNNNILRMKIFGRAYEIKLIPYPDSDFEYYLIDNQELSGIVNKVIDRKNNIQINYNIAALSESLVKLFKTLHKLDNARDWVKLANNADIEKMAKVIALSAYLSLSKFKGIIHIPSIELDEYEESEKEKQQQNNQRNKREVATGGLILHYSSETACDLELLRIILNISNRSKSIVEHKNLVFYTTQHHATRSASTAIIVDSFAHNIAAHCLVALSLYFEKRLSEIPTDVKSFLNDCINYNTPSNFYQIISELYKRVEREDTQLANFLKFMRDKSAFWAGAIGFQSPGGTIMNFYDVLNQFIDNSFFLGTIAYSEGFEGVLIKVNNKFVALSTLNEGVFRYTLNEKGKEEFARVNEFSKLCLLPKNLKSEIPEKYIGDFQNLQIFFPGGVIGLQSLYTLWENILRNIKHSKIKDTIIPFNIELKDLNDMVKITSYLDVKINDAEITANDITNNIKGGIIDVNVKPRMGGNSLMTLCAGFLRGLLPNDINDKIKEINQDLINVIAQEDKIKYTIKLWKGKNCIKWNEIKDKIKSGEENIYRFKILLYDNDNELKEINELERPPVRKIKNEAYDNKENIEEEYNDHYNKWLNEWIFENKITIKYMGNKSEWQKSTDKQLSLNSSLSFIFRHTDKQEKLEPANKHVGVRSHGIFSEFYTEGESFIEQKLNELYEILSTKIVIIDNRLFKEYNTLNQKQKEILSQVLNTKIYEENDDKDKLFGNLCLNNSAQLDKHFLVIHLSNVETLKDKSGKALYKNNLNEFAEEVLKKYRYLVFTSGRNREIKKSKFKENRGKIFFVHLENFLQIFGWAKQIPLEEALRVKYGLVKLLIGI